MAIYIKKAYEDHNEMVREMTRFHEALAGSPAYDEREIAIVVTGENEFTLCVGDDNNRNLEI